MQNSAIKTISAALAALLAANLLSGCGAKTAGTPSPSPTPAQATETASPSPSASPAVKLTRAQIEKKLEPDRASLLNITWAPDNSAVLYLRNSSAGANICIWKTDQESEMVVRKVEPTLDGLLWSPDSKSFLIERGHTSPAAITASVMDAKTLKQLGNDVTTVNVSAPVWSPDSKYLALSTMDESTGKIELGIYALASKNIVSIVSAENATAPYIVEYWKDDTIGYTTLTSSGERAEQTVAVGD